MNDNDLNNDAFFKTLCMDLKVTMDNIGKKNAEVYINSRITSQGRQETYTCDAIDEPEDDHRQSFTRLTRQTACNNNNNNSDSDSDGDDYICRAAMSSSRQTAAINSDSDDEDVQKAAPCSNSNNIQANSEEEEKEEEEGEEEEEDELLATFNKSIRQKATFASPYASPQKLGLMRGVSSQQEDAEEEDEDQ
jgi:hypothetical protein